MFSLRTLLRSTPLILAPMAGVSDLPFRFIARSFGCPLAFTEMINARALGLRNGKTTKLLRSSPLDRPLGVQLLGRDPEFIRQALDALADYPYDVVDLNAACPVHKVTRKGEGSALLREPALLFGLVKALVSRAPVPVTVKIRSGWDYDSINAVEIARGVEDAGADAVCIHARTRKQGYTGRADLGLIRAVKEAVRIPVIASGDLFSREAAAHAFRETGCDAVVIARGALGNPWIFREPPPDGASESSSPARGCRRGDARPVAEIKATMERHLSLSVEHYGPALGVINFRKCFIWYSRGIPNARLLRPRAVRVTGAGEMKALIDEIETPRSPGSFPPASPA